MPIPIERVLDNDLRVITESYQRKAGEAHKRLDDHDERVREMPWYQRAWTYFDRQHEREELVREFDRTLGAVHAVREMDHSVRETIGHYHLATNPDLQQLREHIRQHEPQRDIIAEMTRRPYSRDDLEREL